MSFCTKCGNQMPDGAAFCTKCGNVMKAAAPQQAAPQQAAPQPQMAPQQVAPQQMAPQQMQGQPMYQQYQQPMAPQVPFGQMLKMKAKLVQLIFVIANALLILSCMIPYSRYGGCRFVNGGAGDALGLTMITLSVVTILLVYSVKNKLLITGIAGYNSLLVLVSLITAGRIGVGVGFIFTIISLVALAPMTIAYYMSAEK